MQWKRNYCKYIVYTRSFNTNWSKKIRMWKTLLNLLMTPTMPAIRLKRILKVLKSRLRQRRLSSKKNAKNLITIFNKT